MNLFIVFIVSEWKKSNYEIKRMVEIGKSQTYISFMLN